VTRNRAHIRDSETEFDTLFNTPTLRSPIPFFAFSETYQKRF
jgi:hypothetical protein